VTTDCLVALDAGTGSGRCVIYDPHGRPLAAAREPFHYRGFVDPEMPLVRGFDIDPAEFWGTLAGCTRAALRELPHGARIRGVAATSQREACVFVDREGAVLYAGPNIDARGAIEGVEVMGRISSERLHAITGHYPPHIFPAVRYCWYRKHRSSPTRSPCRWRWARCWRARASAAPS
jgi:sugar (pentulose or hexulose) kinase